MGEAPTRRGELQHSGSSCGDFGEVAASAELHGPAARFYQVTFLLHSFDGLRMLLGVARSLERLFAFDRVLCLQDFGKLGFRAGGWRQVMHVHPCFQVQASNNELLL